MGEVIQRIWKAIAGGLSAGAAAFVAVYPDGITQEEWMKVIGSIVVGGYLVWQAPANAPREPRTAQPDEGTTGTSLGR